VNITNPSKALIALVGLICITILMVTDSISQDAGIGLVSAIIGYAIGNGIAAKQGQPVQPIIGKKAKD
jgi:hypothetical protein